MTKAPSRSSDAIVLKYKKGEQILKQGDYGISIYIIRNGHAEVFREWEGKEVVLGTLGPGDILGETVFLNRGVEVHYASARALRDSEIEVWHPEGLAKKYDELSPVLKALISQMMRRLVRMHRLLDKMAQTVPSLKGTREENLWKETRRYYRKNVDIGCDYTPFLADKAVRNPMKGRIRNLSMTGLRMEIPSGNASLISHDVGSSFRIKTVLPGGQDLRLTAKVVNVHKLQGRVRLGMQFHDLPDYDGTRKTLWFFMLPT